MIACTKCGFKENDNIWKHCGNCGAPLTPAPASKLLSTISPLWLLVLATALIVAGKFLANVGTGIVIGGAK